MIKSIWRFYKECIFFLDGGYFMHLDTRTGNASQSALLESRVFYPKRKEKCLQFFYKLNGSPQDKLVIWVKMDDGTGNVRKMVKLHTIQGESFCDVYIFINSNSDEGNCICFTADSSSAGSSDYLIL